jgi:hypothetical protein
MFKLRIDRYKSQLSNNAQNSHGSKITSKNRARIYPGSCKWQGTNKGFGMEEQLHTIEKSTAYHKSFEDLNDE